MIYFDIKLKDEVSKCYFSVRIHTSCNILEFFNFISILANFINFLYIVSISYKSKFNINYYYINSSFISQ